MVTACRFLCSLEAFDCQEIKDYLLTYLSTTTPHNCHLSNHSFAYCRKVQSVRITFLDHHPVTGTTRWLLCSNGLQVASWTI